jgi:type IV secretory pathway TrbL component
VDDVSLAMQAMVESLLFVGFIYYIPSLMARMVVGGAGSALLAGEAIIGDIAAGASGRALSAIASAAKPGAIGKAATNSAKTVSKMLLR